MDFGDIEWSSRFMEEAAQSAVEQVEKGNLIGESV
jgi:hypothetical protein